MSEQTITATELRGFDPATVRHELDEDVRAFIAYEAMLLDDSKRLWEWFNLLAEDIEYVVPIRVARERKSRFSLYPEGAYHMKENLDTISSRIKRLDTEHAWSEEPPSRLRRIVSGVIVSPTDVENEVRVRSSFILYRGRDIVDHDLLAGFRDDLLRVQDGRLLLARRTIYLDHTVLPTANLGIFL